MIRTLLAGTALALLFVTAAPAAPGGMLSAGYQMTATDALTSKLVGSPIYSTIALNSGAANNAGANANATTSAPAAGANTAAGANGAPAASATDTNAQQIGTIRDLVLSQDGKVNAVVIGIGGVLGLGEKNVAVSYDDVKWTIAQDGSVRGMLDTTADALKAAPDFQWPAGGQATKAGDNNTQATNNGTAPAATGTSAATTAMAPANAPATATANDPQSFANTAAVSNLFEIQSSDLAPKQTHTQAVLDFASKMVTDHTKAGQDMQTAAQSEKVSVPADLDQAHQDQLKQLMGLKDAQFDQAYEDIQLKAHDDAVALFQSYVQSGPDGALKDFAKATLPTLQMHQQMIHKLAGK